ncbi:MAG TPA: glycosyltransferase family 1 protein [Vicinamibacterales bacterium]|nr:glycosyltransferase family 1 protein [Vicinamibacterales bacterium]
MRIVIDYRPALRARTGVGEYIHQAITALARGGTDEITLFSSSWKDRPAAGITDQIPNVRVVDLRIPVRVLNLAWHRLGWPPVEMVTGGRYDVAHSPHPLLLPSRLAAQLVTIHDLHFMARPERTSHEIRRDYPALARRHARRADRIVVSSQFAAGQVRQAFDIPMEKIAVCPGGAPDWAKDLRGGDAGGYLLFLGTLDARKNVGGLLEAYGRLLSSRRDVPRLILAGAPAAGAARWLDDIARPPLAGHVEHLGYVGADRRRSLFQGARIFVLPSFEEGFGLPALEAMAAGVPVVASNRGSLPEVVGDAGLLVNPDESDALASAIRRLLSEPALWQALRQRGLDRARQFSWDQTARDLRRAYEDAITAHAHRH